MTEWKQIKENPNYSVSTDGQVRNDITGKLIKPCKNKGGYYLVCLPYNGKQKTFYTHTLVATAFIPNPDNYKEINHKDEDKSNNTVENLEWISHQDNINYGTRKDRAITTMILNNNTHPIIEVNSGLISPTITEASKLFDISSNSIRNSLRRNKEYHGLHFKYLEEI